MTEPTIEITLKSLITRNPCRILREENDGSAILLDRETGDALRLNQTAAEIWKLLDVSRTLGQVMEKLKNKYVDMEIRAEKEVLELANDLYGLGAIGLRKNGEVIMVRMNRINVMPVPRELDLEVTSRCNARCSYCYYLNNEGVVYEDLPTSRWLQLFEEMGRAKVEKVCLSGGEALIREDIFELIEGVVKNGMHFRLLTNGRLVTPEVARRFRETEHCSIVQVSLDGSRAEVHESQRGKGSFEPALNAIRVLKDAGVPTTVRVTIHAQNIEDLPNIARLLLEEINLPAFGTNAASSLGTREKYGDSILLTPTQRLRAMKVMANLDEQYPGRIQAAAGPLAEWKGFHEMENARLNGTPIAGRGRLVGCGCIFSKMTVRADGAFVPCVMLPQMVMGYMGKDRIEEIWRNSPVLESLRQRVTIPLEKFSECNGCEYLQSCTGSCPGGALSLMGEPNRPSPDACLRRFKKEIEAVGLALW